MCNYQYASTGYLNPLLLKDIGDRETEIPQPLDI